HAVPTRRSSDLEIWCPTQNPQAVQDTVSAALGIDKKNVICHVTLLGGGFGRKSKPDYAAEAAILSKKLGKPVKVVWTREDDIHHDFYHTTAAVYHKASIGAKGKPTAWLQRSVFPPIASTFGAPAPLGFELDMGLDDTLYDVPNIRAENSGADAHVRIGWFRAVTNNFHAFAAHSFADELAHSANRDTLEFLLDMLGPGKVIDLKAQGVDYSNYGAPIDKYPVDSRRLRRVLEVAGEKSNGRIDQKKFDGFRVARTNDAPVQVNVHLVESGNPPTGVGEPGLPPVIAALANAIYSATGKRIREMPFSKTKLV